MSVSDPLLKILKGYVYKLRTESDVVTDYNPILHQFCDTIEQIYRKGLKKQNSLFGLSKKDYWSWIQDLPDYIAANRLNPSLTYALSQVKACKKVRTVQGRGRLFLRFALAKRSLDIPVTYIRNTHALLDEWYEATSIFGDEILTEIFLSLVTEIKEINFKIRLPNASFLDETWIIPVYRRYEFVPTKVLGIHISYVRGRIIARGVKEGSVAAEDNKIEVGDVLEQMFDECLIDVGDWKINSLLKQAEGYPIYLNVVKARYVTSRIFPPIAERLRDLGISVEELESKYLSQVGYNAARRGIGEGDEEPNIETLLGPDFPEDTEMQPAETMSQHPDGWGQFSLYYVGQVEIGEFGGVGMIDTGIAQVVNRLGSFGQRKPVLMKLGESVLEVKDQETGEPLLRHSYTEISSCGRRVRDETLFGYIAGETSCRLAKQFTCFVFDAKLGADAKAILCSLAQGFNRTHWLM